MSSNTSSTLSITFSDTGVKYSVDYLHPSSRATTYRDLKQLLSRLHGVRAEHHQFLRSDEDGSAVPLPDSEPITSAYPALSLHPVQYDVRVQHYAQLWPSPDNFVTLDSTLTVRQLKAMVAKDVQDAMTVLTLDGQLLSDDSPLHELALSESSVNLLVGKLAVVVVDVETDRQTSVDELSSSSTVADVKRDYAKKEKRVNIERAELSFKRPEDDSTRPLSDGQSLHSASVVHDSLLQLKTPPYVITIREGAAAHDITVFDHYLPQQLKEEFNKLSANPLTSGDSLVFNDEQMAETAELYKLRMKERSVVFVSREDVSLQRFDFLCADCGNDVKLKKTDAVRCRECGHRILYKKRTTKRQQRRTEEPLTLRAVLSLPLCAALMLCCRRVLTCTSACQYLCR